MVVNLRIARTSQPEGTHAGKIGPALVRWTWPGSAFRPKHKLGACAEQIVGVFDGAKHASHSTLHESACRRAFMRCNRYYPCRRSRRRRFCRLGRLHEIQNAGRNQAQDRQYDSGRPQRRLGTRHPGGIRHRGDGPSHAELALTGWAPAILPYLRVREESNSTATWTAKTNQSGSYQNAPFALLHHSWAADVNQATRNVT